MRFVIFYSIHFITWNDMKLLSKMSIMLICWQIIAICCQIFACWQLPRTYMLSKIISMLWLLHSCRHRVIKIGKARRDMAAEDFNTTTNLQIAITIGTELQASTQWNHLKMIRTYDFAICHHMFLLFRETIMKVSRACDSIFSNRIGLNAKR